MVTFYHNIHGANDKVRATFGKKGRDRHGHYKEYSYTGMLCISGHYLRGKMSGRWLFYSKLGLASVCRYVRNQRHGLSTFLWTKGNKRCRVNFKNGLAHGWAYYWNPDGALQMKRRYHNGVIVSVKEFAPLEPGEERASGLLVSEFECAHDGDPWNVTGESLAYLLGGNNRRRGLDLVIAAELPSEPAREAEEEEEEEEVY